MSLGSERQSSHLGSLRQSGTRPRHCVGTRDGSAGFEPLSSQNFSSSGWPSRGGDHDHRDPQSVKSPARGRSRRYPRPGGEVHRARIVTMARQPSKYLNNSKLSLRLTRLYNNVILGRSGNWLVPATAHVLEVPSFYSSISAVPSGQAGGPVTAARAGRLASGSSLGLHAGFFGGPPHRYRASGNLSGIRSCCDEQSCAARPHSEHVVCAAQPLGGRRAQPSRARPTHRAEPSRRRCGSECT